MLGPLLRPFRRGTDEPIYPVHDMAMNHALSPKDHGSVLKQLIGSDGVLFEENATPGPHHVDNKAIFAKIFPYRRRFTSSVVTTKNWCQDVWANRYLGVLFDRSDAAASIGS